MSCYDFDTYASWHRERLQFLRERISRQGRILCRRKLELEGNQYKATFNGNWKVGKKDFSHGVWQEMVHWEGTGLIEGPQTLDFIFTTQYYNNGEYSQGHNSFNIEEDLIQFFHNGERRLIEPSNFLDYKTILDLALSKMVENKQAALTKASSFLNPSNTPVVFPARFDFKDLWERKLIKNPVENRDIQYMFYHLIK